MTHDSDTELKKLALDFPGWAIWQGMRSDDRPGDYYANRRRWSADLPAEASLTVVGASVEGLRAALVEQAELEDGGEGS